MYPNKLATGPIINVFDFVNNKNASNGCVLLTSNILYGTGSNPPFEKGLHFKIRLHVSHSPLHTPYFSNASMAYCEQVGV